jgi:hypothetical protein
MKILELRKRAESELRVLFGQENPTETQIMYLVGLYMADVDTVSIAINMMNKEWEELYPTSPGMDEPEESEEQKAKARWEKRAK